MWRLVERLLQIILLVATAATAFVIAAVVWSSLRPQDGTGLAVDPADARVEVRLSSHGDVSRVFIGQPIVVEVVLLNLEARRARNETQVDPAGAAAAAEILLDYEDSASDPPWERRLTMTLSTPGGATVLNTLDWHARLLDPGGASTPPAAGLGTGENDARHRWRRPGEPPSRPIHPAGHVTARDRGAGERDRDPA